MHIAEWTVWGLAALATLRWSWSFRRLVAKGEGVLVAMAVVPMLWLVSLIAVPALGYSQLHLLWLFPLGLLLALFPPFFPLSLLSYAGKLYGAICCLGLQVPEGPTEEELMTWVDDVFEMLEKRYGEELRRERRTDARRGRKATMHRKTGRKAWMRVLNKDDINRLQNLLAAKGTKWRTWEYKLHGGNILIYSPVTPWDHDAGKYDHSRRRMAKHLRIVPVEPGPFQLEYMRHTGRWCPIDVCVGDLETIADFIEDDPLGLCHPKDPPDVDQPRLKFHPPAG